MPSRAISAAVLGLALGGVQAQSPADPPCQYTVSRQVSFTSPTAKNQLTVSIGPGACHSAELSIVITSARGEVLYRYVALFKKHVVTQWDDPSLPEDAREFVNETASRALIPRSEVPSPKARGQTEEGEAELTVPVPVYKRLVSSGQPMLYHRTYYEGGQYVVFDPVTRRARVVALWGV
jgi:hypothetical protein